MKHRDDPHVTSHGGARSSRGTLYECLVALGAVAVMLLIRWPLEPLLDGSVPYLTCFGAVAFALWHGRWKPAALAAIVGFLAANYFVAPPAFEFNLTDSRTLLARVLESHRARVINAASAEEGMFAVREHRPNIVLCDIGMPGVDGYQFIRELRETGDHTPALAVTAFARAEDRLRALRAGYQGHVTKPVNPAELLATIAVFVGHRQEPTEGP